MDFISHVGVSMCVCVWGGVGLYGREVAQKSLLYG